MNVDWVPAGIDVNAASAARIHDYHLGGQYNFPADRWAAQRAAELLPALLASVRANRAFLQRAVAYLVRAGVRQFLDLGSGIPTAGNVHEVAHAVDPTARTVYVDVDPVAVAHGTAMLTGVDSAAMVRADLRDVPLVLAAPAARDLIDFHQPVAVLMVSVLHLLSKADDRAGIIARYRDAVPSGSHLVLSHDFSRDADPRVQDEFRSWFDGWDLVEPGATSVSRWRVHEREKAMPGLDAIPDVCAVARKP